MATLIENIPLSEFRKLKAPELKRLNSCEVTSDGEYSFTFVKPNTDFIRLSAENLSQLSNSIAGETLENITKKEVANIY